MEISFLNKCLSQFSFRKDILITQNIFREKGTASIFILAHSSNKITILGELQWEKYPLWENLNDNFPRPLSSVVQKWLRERINLNDSVYSSHPVQIGGFIPFYWLHEISTGLSEDYYRIEQYLLLTLLRSTLDTFNVEKLKRITTKNHLQQQLLTFFCDSLAPIAYKRNENSLWVPYCKTMYDDGETLEYDLPFGKLRAGNCEQEQILWLQNYLTGLYSDIVEKWELCHQQSIQIANRIDILVANFEESKNKLETYFSTHKQYLSEIVELKQMAEKLVHPGASNNFEFFRGTDSWVIRFNNSPVKMKNKYTLGLIHIHQLLLNPGKNIYCHQLYLRSNNDLEQASPVWKEIHQRFNYQSIADNEQEWQEAIERIEKGISGASADIKMDLMEYIVFLAEQRYRNHISRSNFDKLLYYQKKLKLTRLDAMQSLENDVHYQRQITLKGVLFKNAENPKDHNRKIYQNVTKAIKRSIKAMDNEPIIRHFQQCLKIGNPCCYQPEVPGIDPPVWKLWID